MRVDLSKSNSVNAYAYRFDYGQNLEVTGIELPEEFEVHFQNGSAEPLAVKGKYNATENVGIVPIPDECLQQAVSSFNAWLWVEDEQGGKTLKTIIIRLIQRDKPPDVPLVSSVKEIKAYADYVKENADKVTEAETAAGNAEAAAQAAQNMVDDITAKLEAGEFNGKDGADGKDGINGIDGKDGAPGAAGPPGEKGESYILTESDKADIASLVASQSVNLKTVFAFTEDEFNEILMDLMQDFMSNVPLNIIYVTDEGTSQLMVLDSGNGEFEDCILIQNGFSDVPFTQEVSDTVNANSRKNAFIERAEYKNKTYSTGATNVVSFSGTGTSNVRSVRVSITLPLLKNVKFGIEVNKISGSLVADQLLADELTYTVNNLIIEIDTYSEGYYMITITLIDGTGVIYSHKQLSASGTTDRIGSFKFRIDADSTTTYTLDYVGIGG